jgi:hypothetical protein
MFIQFVGSFGGCSPCANEWDKEKYLVFTGFCFLPISGPANFVIVAAPYFCF